MEKDVEKQAEVAGEKPDNLSAGTETDTLKENPAPASEGAQGENGPEKEMKNGFRFRKPIDELYDESVSEGQAAEQNPARENPAGPSKRKKKKKTGRLLAVLYSLLALGFVGLLAAFAVSCFSDMYAITRDDREIEVTIPPNASAVKIADTLKADGVIGNSLAFRLYVRIRHVSGFQHGTYKLNSDMDYSEISYILKRVPTVSAVVKVTIPEGKTLEQIGSILEEKGVCSQQEFISALKAGGFTFDKQNLIPNNKNRFYKYEGYLFPDTYQFYKDSSGKSAAQKFFSRFTEVFTPQMKAKASQMNMTVDQAVTLASIIQAETGNTQQMPYVSSVFYNRLKNGVKENGGRKFLQSDATIFYVLRDIQPVLQQSSTEVSSAYNTYKNEGLPPGPICNPGTDALNAALNPAATNYYYFVTDSSGNYYYAQTYGQHAKNVRKALKSSSARGTDIYK